VLVGLPRRFRDNHRANPLGRVNKFDLAKNVGIELEIMLNGDAGFDMRLAQDHVCIDVGPTHPSGPHRILVGDTADHP